MISCPPETRALSLKSSISLVIAMYLRKVRPNALDLVKENFLKVVLGLSIIK